MNPMVSAIELVQMPEVRTHGIRFSYTLLSLVLIVDQLLLPMFRLGPVSFKFSYLILGFWLLHWLSRLNKVANGLRDINRVFGVFAVILSCILLGECWLGFFYNVPSYYEAIRGSLTLVFAALAFGLGRSSTRFRLEWLLPILFTAIALNMLFIIFRTDLPSWLIYFYVPERATYDRIGFQSVEDIIALARPRGIFGNPNASMLMVNLIVLFIHLAIRNKVLRIRSATAATLLIVLPVFLSMMLASRGEFLVSLLLAFLNYRALAFRQGRSLRKMVTMTILIFFIVAMGTIFFLKVGDDIGFKHEAKRLYHLLQLFEQRDGEEKAFTILRPLITLKSFIGRFSKSPLFGTGISAADADHFSDGTQYFHNDWFYILTVSGLFGFFSMFWLLCHFWFRLGWPILIPFVLPGLINTFMTNIPAFIAYFGMTGILYAQCKPICNKKRALCKGRNAIYQN